MKQISLAFSTILFTFHICAQTISPELISVSGDYYENVNASISFSVGEIATETYNNSNNFLIQGFQQPVSLVITGVDLDLLVFLEGPFSGTQMATGLNIAGSIPLNQPYNTAPWFYPGSESVISIPNPNIVDWILIELRDAPDAGSATPATSIAKQAGFLLNDGSVVSLDGSSILSFNHSIIQSLFVVIWHRNHLGIMSSTGVPQSGGIYSWDFSTSVTQVYNGSAGYKEIVTNVYGMPGGDGNADGSINSTDKLLWTNDAGSKGYKATDFNLDSQVSNQDKNEIYVPNGIYNSQVPQ